MVHIGDVSIPDNLTELGALGNDIKTWVEMKYTIERGLASVLAAESTGPQIVGTHHFESSYHRIPTTRTPEFKSYLKRPEGVL